MTGTFTYAAKKTKKCEVIGNKKKITQYVNYGKLHVIGNNCKIFMKNNYGHVEVIGNNCVVNIEENYGNVKYTGNCGVLKISFCKSLDSVSCVGNECKVYIKHLDETSPDRLYPQKGFHELDEDIFDSCIMDNIFKIVR